MKKYHYIKESTHHEKAPTFKEYRQALTDFHTAADNLLEPFQITTIEGNTFTAAPLTDQMQAQHRAPHTGHPPKKVFTSQPCIWVDGLDWETNLHNILAPLQPHTPGQTPQNHLTKARNKPYNPTYVEELYQAAHSLKQAWFQAITLLYPPSFSLQAACPQCGKKSHTTRDEIGRRKTGPTLTVHEFFATCAHCKTTWWGQQIADLAELINQPIITLPSNEERG